MHPRDVWVHRATVALIAAAFVTVAVLRDVSTAIMSLSSSGIVAVTLAGFDRHYYGPRRR